MHAHAPVPTRQVGIYFYTHVRPLGGIQAAPPTVVDVIYFIMVTLTTVGYGDFHPLRQVGPMRRACRAARVHRGDSTCVWLAEERCVGEGARD
eukprot:355136-Chlamydomonas_euryale.AAC.4